MILYFLIMWTSCFGLMFYLNRRVGPKEGYNYETAVVQSFTVGSNK